MGHVNSAAPRWVFAKFSTQKSKELHVRLTTSSQTMSILTPIFVFVTPQVWVQEIDFVFFPKCLWNLWCRVLLRRLRSVSIVFGKNCEICENVDDCSSCVNNNVVEVGTPDKCRPCSWLHSECVMCSDQSVGDPQCDSFSNGWVPSSDSPYCSCDPTYLENCDQCSDLNNCTQCSSGYFLQDGDCQLCNSTMTFCEICDSEVESVKEVPNKTLRERWKERSGAEAICVKKFP